MNGIELFIEALRKGRGFDWIANHGHNLSSYELINIIKEYDYAIQDNVDAYDAKSIYNAAADELSDYYLCEE